MTKVFKEKANLTVLVLLLGVLIFPHLSQAQSDELQDALKEVDQKIEQVDGNTDNKTTQEEDPEAKTKEALLESDQSDPALMAKDPGQNPSVEEEGPDPEAQAKELADKKDALLSVVEYTRLERDEAAKKITQVLKKTNDSTILKAAEINDELLGLRLEYLENLQTIFDKEELDLDQVQSIATELKTWRDQLYNPEIKNSLDLFIVHQAELITAKTKTRMEKVAQDVDKIQAFTKSDSLTPYLESANKELERAIFYYVSARQLVASATFDRNNLLNPAPQEEELAKNTDLKLEVAPVKEDLSSQEQEQESPKTLKELLAENKLVIEDAHTAVQGYAEKISQSIRSVYDTLFEMSTAAKKLLAK